MKNFRKADVNLLNRPEPCLDKFHSSDDLTNQESIKQNYSISHNSRSYLFGVQNNSVTDITDSFMKCPKDKFTIYVPVKSKDRKSVV